MAEITKVTTPMIPQENGGKYKPATDQAQELNDPTRVHKTGQEPGISDGRAEGEALREQMAGAALPLLRGTGELSHVLLRMMAVLQMGISASDALADPKVKELIRQAFVPAKGLLGLLEEQAEGAVLFRGPAFDALREVMAKFSGNPGVREAAADLLKAFDHRVNADSSVKVILHSCAGILDYLFSGDRQQFGDYLRGLAELLLPGTAEGGEGELPPAEWLPPEVAAYQAGEKTGVGVMDGIPGQKPGAPTGPVDPQEAARILKGNLLPLLGEIVVKYHQNARIRDIVMVVVHHIVRIDQGTPQALREAADALVRELGQVATLPQGFRQELEEELLRSVTAARVRRNGVMENLAEAVARALGGKGSSTPAQARQAETLLMSLLHGENSAMNLLHYILPMATPDGPVVAELYVDPDSGESNRPGGGKARKIFLTATSEAHGSFELTFLQAGDRVDFSLWCPGVLVEGLNRMKRQFAGVMQAHGYTMGSFQVEELRTPRSIAQVFPHLLEGRMGFDVRA